MLAVGVRVLGAFLLLALAGAFTAWDGTAVVAEVKGGGSRIGPPPAIHTK
jgi:hypothetical protein